MAASLGIDEFLAQAGDRVVVDVRTPAEFLAGHIPGAINLPLFSNDERAEVGTAYVREGRQNAVRIGLDRVGPKLGTLAGALQDAAVSSPRGLLIHCWRGGMRSTSMAWLAETLDIPVATLRGGYKSFRRRALAILEEERPVRVVSGLTGAGKTAILHELHRLGEPVINLEALARHKGSAFGDLGEAPQPTQEQFENDLAIAWMSAGNDHPVWIEDESRMIGRRVIPDGVWNSKTNGRFEQVDLPVEERIAHLRSIYAGFPNSAIAPRIEAVRTRLGGLRCKQALEALDAGDLDQVCRILLTYYDRTYSKSLESRDPAMLRIHRFESLDPPTIARALIHAVNPAFTP